MVHLLMPSAAQAGAGSWSPCQDAALCWCQPGCCSVHTALDMPSAALLFFLHPQVHEGAPCVPTFLSLGMCLGFRSFQDGMCLRCTSRAEEGDCVPGLQKRWHCSDFLVFMSLTLFLWTLFLLVAALLKA